jgi:hypothetical protein
MLDHATAEQFIRPEHRGIILSATEPKRLIEKLVGYVPPILPNWIDRNQR